MALADETVSELNEAIEAATTKVAEEDTETTQETSTAAVETEVVDDGQSTEVSDTTTTEPVVNTEVKTGVSDEALTRAIRAGLSYADAKSFQSDESLNRVTESIEAAKRPTKQTDATVETTQEDILASLPTLDPEVYDEGVIKMYDGLVGVIRKQQEALNILKSNADQVLQTNSLASQHETERWFDDSIAKLGDDFKEAVGDGSYKSLQPGTPQYAKRDAIANTVAVLYAGCKSHGLNPSRDELFDQAAKLVLRDEYMKVNETRLAADLAKRSTQHIQRVGSQNNKSKGDPIADVAAMLDEKYFQKV